ncbi:MAG: ABC transporter ATP-binding protein [Burkholderiaceae bacterium]|nr:ABC transporter ATP-binding protein [Burkholderiaceae bacterium]
MSAGVDLRAEAVQVALGGRPVLHDLTLALRPGWTAIVGPNGAGKSTLLRTLAGLQPVESGQVWLDGRPIQQWRPAQRAPRLAWLAQQGQVSGDLTVGETVALGRIAHLGLLGSPGPDDAAAVAQAMALTECTAWAGRRLQALSGGERQRVLLARALATGAPLLLLDEPTTHLDAPHQVALARLFRRLAATQTVVSVLHDLPIAVHADRLLLLREGRLVADGDPREPALQQALAALFDGAVRLSPGGAAGAAPQVSLALD